MKKDKALEMTVQPVLLVEKPFLEIGHIKKHSRRMQQAIQDWSDFAGRITNKPDFYDNLQKQDQILSNVLRTEWSLLHDFQVIVDTKGNAIHYDLDRGYKNRDDAEPYSKIPSIQEAIDHIKTEFGWADDDDSPTHDDDDSVDNASNSTDDDGYDDDGTG